MNEFHILQSLPPEWFEYKENKWYAKTQVANSTSEEERKYLDKNELIECDIIMVSLLSNDIIPINIYDEHQNGKAVVKSFYSKYNVCVDDYFPIILQGLNTPCTQDDVNKMKIIFNKLLDSNIDISETEVYIGYLTKKYEKAEISIQNFLDDNYGSEIIQQPLTEIGLQFVEVFETFRDSFNKRINDKFPKQKLKTNLKKLYKLMKKYGFSNDQEYENICNVVDLYYENEITEEEFESKLFAFDGYRNTIHNRIRNKIDDEEFKELVGNPIMLNNIMDCM